MNEATEVQKTDTPAKLGQSDSIQIIPIITGLAVDIVGTFLFGLIVGVLIAVSQGIASTDDMQKTITAFMTAPFVVGAFSVLGFLFSLLGGYVTARMAKSKKLFHTEILAYVTITIAVLTSILPGVAAGTAVPENIAITAVTIALSFFAIGLGGKLASSTDTDTTGVLAYIFQQKRVSVKLYSLATALLIVLVSFGGAYLQKDTVSCTVETIYLYGTMYTTPPAYIDEESDDSAPETYSAGLAEALAEIRDNDKIKAIIVEVDSPGGSPVAGEEIAKALERSGKHVVVYIRSIAASAAYWAVSGADVIFASSNADVGGIGVSVNYLDSYEKNRREGLNSNIISSAKYKTLGDPNLPLTDEQRTIIQRDVDEIHKNFVTAVSENRGLPVEDVELIADGATMLGSRALEKNLIDRIGDMEDAKAYLKEFLGEEPRICTSIYPD